MRLYGVFLLKMKSLPGQIPDLVEAGSMRKFAFTGTGHRFKQIKIYSHILQRDVLQKKSRRSLCTPRRTVLAFRAFFGGKAP